MTVSESDFSMKVPVALMLAGVALKAVGFLGGRKLIPLGSSPEKMASLLQLGGDFLAFGGAIHAVSKAARGLKALSEDKELEGLKGRVTELERKLAPPVSPDTGEKTTVLKPDPKGGNTGASGSGADSGARVGTNLVKDPLKL